MGVKSLCESSDRERSVDSRVQTYQQAVVFTTFSNTETKTLDWTAKVPREHAPRSLLCCPYDAVDVCTPPVHADKIERP